MHGFYEGLVFFADVVIDFFFGVEYFAALWAHVLSSVGFRCTSALDDLT